MSNNNRIATNTLYLYLRTGVTVLVGLYTSRLLLDALGTVDFGLYFLIAGFVLLLGFLKSSLTSGVRRFIAYELGQNNQEQLKRTFSMAVNIHLIATAIFLVIGETAGLSLVFNELTIPDERIDAVFWVYQSSLVGFCFTLMTLPHLALILAHEDIKIFATVTLLESLFKLAITYSLSWMIHDRLIIYSLLIFVLNMAIAVSYVVYSKKAYRRIPYILIWDSRLFKSISSFSALTIIGNLSFAMSNQGANLLLNVFFGPILNAAKAIASQVNGATTSFSSNFLVALTPPIIKSYSSGNYDYSRQLVYKGSKYSFFLMLLVAFSLFNNLTPVFDSWLSEYPSEAVTFTQVILLISLLSATSRPLTAAAQATGRIKAYQIVVGGVSLTSIPLAYILLSSGMEAIWTFYAIFIVNAVAFFVRILMLRRIFEFSIHDYIKTALLPIIAVALVASFATSYLSFTSNMFINLLLDMGLTLFVIIVIGLSRHERWYLLDKVRSLIKR